MTHWDHEYDVVVVGSGAGGMTAALCAHAQGLSTLLIEKDAVYGGTSAVSGGGIWIPNNDQVETKGGRDTDAAARHYAHALTEGDSPRERVDAYLDHGPEMVRYLSREFGIEYDLVVKYPDYFQNTAGALDGWRSMEPAVFDAAKLGDELANQRAPYAGTLVMGRFAMSQAEAQVILSKSKGWAWLLTKIMLGYIFDWPWRFRSKRDRRLKLGQGMVAALRHAMLKQDVPLWLNTGFEDLIEADGRIAGVVVTRNGKQERIQARRGVVLACGGFESNQALRERFLPGPTSTDWSVAPGCNHGEGILAAEKVGAELRGMDRVWGVPAVPTPGDGPATSLFVERNLPRMVLVNQRGERYINEALAYTEAVYEMRRNQQETDSTVPSWFVFDSVYRKEYPVGPIMPAMIQPDSKLPKDWEGEVFHKADSLEVLADKAGINANGLGETIQRFNRFAASGKDEDFGKGENPFDVYYGDARLKPNPCLGPIEKPPFYAVRVLPGELGTNGGISADTAGRALRDDGSVINGLYAIGNVSSAVMGRSYPGAGSTLGPAMVYGYLAARDLASLNVSTPMSEAA